MQMINNLYSDVERGRKLNKLIRSLYKYKPVMGLFVITLPLEKGALLEVYNYNVLLQPYYSERDDEIVVVGVTKSKDSANEILRRITEDTLKTLRCLDIKEYFKENFDLIALPKKRMKKK
ncbi:hypothetical protein SAMN04487934_10155 [Eubacterium ruminantium]|nr:hypothetical protein SAMN04487934_10155 [Eubacterium ruminantium]